MPKPSSKVPLYVVWDFDGTIAATKEIVLKIINSKTATYKLPPFKTIYEIESTIRHNDLPFVPKLSLQLSFFWQRDAIEVEVLDAIAKAVLADAQMQKDEQPPSEYKVALVDGIEDCVKTLKLYGCKQIIMTANRRDTVVTFLKNYNLFEYFSGIQSTPNKTLTLASYINARGLDPAQVYCVGDQVSDILHTRIANTIAVTWGFDSEASLKAVGPNATIEYPAELLSIIAKRLNLASPEPKQRAYSIL